MSQYSWWKFYCLFCLFGKSFSYINQNTQLNTLHAEMAPLSNQNCKTDLRIGRFLAVMAELAQSPPTCVCFKLCDDQRTYCYPEGCLEKKRVERRAREMNAHSIKRVFDPSPLSFSSAKRQRKMQVSDSMRFEFETATKQFGPLKQRSWLSEIRPNTFIDRYRHLVKYKKMPQLELRYNFKDRSNNIFKDHHAFAVFNLKRAQNHIKTSSMLDKIRSLGTNNAPIHSKRNFYIKNVVPLKLLRMQSENEGKRITKREQKSQENFAKVGFFDGNMYTDILQREFDEY